MNRRRITVRPSEHPAVSSAVTRRIQEALAAQPRHTAVTAAKLASEIVEDLTRKRAVRLVQVDLDTYSADVTITVRCFGSAPDAGWKLGGLERLRLDRLATHWGEEAGLNRIWFELANESNSSRLEARRETHMFTVSVEDYPRVCPLAIAKVHLRPLHSRLDQHVSGIAGEATRSRAAGKLRSQPIPGDHSDRPRGATDKLVGGNAGRRRQAQRQQPWCDRPTDTARTCERWRRWGVGDGARLCVCTEGSEHEQGPQSRRHELRGCDQVLRRAAARP